MLLNPNMYPRRFVPEAGVPREAKQVQEVWSRFNSFYDSSEAAGEALGVFMLACDILRLLRVCGVDSEAISG